MPCLEELRRAGYRVGVVGNHFADFTDTLRRMNVPLDFVSSSEEWGVEKPSPDFFTRIVQVSGVTLRELRMSETASTMMCCRPKRLEW
jgi:FMN phosphatase YigB (HAD superfamily)